MSARTPSFPRFSGSQLAIGTDRPLTYTGSPWHLFAYDIRLFFRNFFYLPFIFLPLSPYPNGSLDEFYPTVGNIRDLTLHFILFFVQIGFLVSLPFLTWISTWLYISYIAGSLLLNTLVCRLLNGSIPEDGLKSTEDDFSRTWKAHDDEYWIFLNGICVGKHWLQNNIDRLSRTFHRPVVGVHNKTSGVVFDIFQCLIQRALLFATGDIRECYVLVKKALYRPGIKKVVLVLHSQGGIEGGMIIDWLLNEVPQDLLQYLEVYTFGCIANHFNNPYRNLKSYDTAAEYLKGRHKDKAMAPCPHRAISHIEHYANAYDFASRWGVLHYTQSMPSNWLENRFLGRVFTNPKSGHQFNQHYLGSIFPFDETNHAIRDPQEGDFMSLDAPEGSNDDCGERQTPMQSLRATDQANGEKKKDGKGKLKMWQLSRLWMYRNGMSPPKPKDR